VHHNTVVRKATVWALLFLPLVAVGVALALMLTWGHQASQQAEAADPAIDFSLTLLGGENSGGTGTYAALPLGGCSTVGDAGDGERDGFERGLELRATSRPTCSPRRARPSAAGLR